MIAGLQKTLSTTKFRDAPILPIAANVGAVDVLNNPSLTPQVENIDSLIQALRDTIRVPERASSGDFLFAIDHCFAIKGQGTVMTGTVLKGGVAVGDVSTDFCNVLILKKKKKKDKEIGWYAQLYTICFAVCYGYRPSK